MLSIRTFFVYAYRICNVAFAGALGLLFLAAAFNQSRIHTAGFAGTIAQPNLFLMMLAIVALGLCVCSIICLTGWWKGLQRPVKIALPFLLTTLMLLFFFVLVLR